MPDSYQHLANPSCLDCMKFIRMLEAASVDIENAETDLKAKRRRISDLEARLHKQEEQVVVDEQIRRVFELFRIIRNKTNRFRLDKKRRELISTLLNLGYEEIDFRQAFMGVELRAAKHPDGDRHYTLNFVCRDADTLEKFRDAYLSHWAQFDSPRIDGGRVEAFAEGSDPASVVEPPAGNVVRFEKPARRAA